MGGEATDRGRSLVRRDSLKSMAEEAVRNSGGSARLDLVLGEAFGPVQRNCALSAGAYHRRPDSLGFLVAAVVPGTGLVPESQMQAILPHNNSLLLRVSQMGFGAKSVSHRPPRARCSETARQRHGTPDRPSQATISSPCESR